MAKNKKISQSAILSGYQRASNNKNKRIAKLKEQEEEDKKNKEIEKKLFLEKQRLQETQEEEKRKKEEEERILENELKTFKIKITTLSHLYHQAPQKSPTQRKESKKFV